MSRELAVEVLRVVVPPDAFLAAGVADALDHRGVVGGVGEDDRAGQPGAERRERSPVRDVAGGEEQRRLLAVQVGEFALEQHVVVGGAGDVAGAAGAGAAAVDRIVHRRDDLRVLAHAEVVVRAPDGDVAGALADVAGGAREGAVGARELGEDAVVALLAERVELLAEQGVVVHALPLLPPAARRPCRRRAATGRDPHRIGAAPRGPNSMLDPACGDESQPNRAPTLVGQVGAGDVRSSPCLGT